MGQSNNKRVFMLRSNPAERSNDRVARKFTELIYKMSCAALYDKLCQRNGVNSQR